MITYMKLQTLLDLGAQTVAGDVLWFSPVRNRQVKLADWKGGEDCVLTAEGVFHDDEGLLLPKTPTPGFKRPPKNKGLADLDLGEDK